MWYVSDLDGTLLNKRASLSAKHYTMLEACLASGMLFSVASARGIKTIRSCIGPNMPIQLPVIGMNGATISDFASGEHLHINKIDPYIVAETILLARLNKLSPFISSVGNGAEALWYDEVCNPGMRWYVSNRVKAKDERLKHVQDVAAQNFSSVASLTFMGEEGLIKDFADQIEQSFPGQLRLHVYENQYSPGWFWINMHDASASKASAIQWVADYAELSHLPLTVFGDNYNDMSMFALAQKAIATSNAEGELKKMANEIIGHHHQGAVIEYLSALHLDTA